MNNVGLLTFYVVAAAVVVLGLCMMMGLFTGRMAEGLAIVFIGLMALLWARNSSKSGAAGS